MRTHKTPPERTATVSSIGITSGNRLLKIDLTDTRSLPKKRRRAMLDPCHRDSLLSLA